MGSASSLLSSICQVFPTFYLLIQYHLSLVLIYHQSFCLYCSVFPTIGIVQNKSIIKVVASRWIKCVIFHWPPVTHANGCYPEMPLVLPSALNYYQRETIKCVERIREKEMINIIKKRKTINIKLMHSLR